MIVWGRQRRGQNLLDLARNSVTWPNIIITFISFFSLCFDFLSYMIRPHNKSGHTITIIWSLSQLKLQLTFKMLDLKNVNWTRQGLVFESWSYCWTYFKRLSRNDIIVTNSQSFCRIPFFWGWASSKHERFFQINLILCWGAFTNNHKSNNQ